ncbi:MAG: hypothetical protein Satyrvirus18_8 [Satyrvirus sp.]|uniref:DUF7275 domain-containing protein n=1 Tax=Satyrvirus sp. TaxID=2487771 RepID=A0A3G5AGP4_9VIRU|nr:MAG: hypothetical protein Satyrvirus18_8 [Satyrvirus sp.]
MLPILIGSYALYEYKLVNSYNDIDLITDDVTAGHLSLICDKKKGKMLWFGNTKVDLHLVNDLSSNLILTKCNLVGNTEPPFKCQKIELPMCTALLPPLEILYVIMKSHIHRIIPVTPFQDQNIDIWLEHVKKYKIVRDYIGYSKLDSILYESYLGPWKEISVEDTLENFLLKIYQTRFDETNKRIGDTPISLDKSEDDFFKDNVERFIDHDELHKQIGIVFRSDPVPIFIKYQSDSNNVNLDLDTFLKSSHMERIEMLREEIMVLLLERKWIPVIIKIFKEMKIPYSNYNINDKKKELIEVGANFITNLCGQGDAWLRRYCLDHVHLLLELDTEIYDYDKLRNLAQKLTNYDHQSEIIREKNIFKQISEYGNGNIKFFENYIHLIDKHKSGVAGKDTGEIVIEYLDINGFVYGPDDYLNDLTDDFSYEEFKFTLDTSDREMGQTFEYFGDGYNIGYIKSGMEFMVYNLKKNIGIYRKKDNIQIFTFGIYNVNKKVYVNGFYTDIMCHSKENFEDAYVAKTKIVFYHSDGCEFSENRESKFLSSYGTAPIFMKRIFELFARDFFNKNNREWWDNSCIMQKSDSDYSDSD